MRYNIASQGRFRAVMAMAKKKKAADRETVNERKDVRLGRKSQAAKETVDERRDLRVGQKDTSVSPPPASFSPATEQFLQRAESLQSEIVKRLAPLHKKLRRLLDSIEGTSFPLGEVGIGEAHVVIRSISLLTKQAGCQLLYDGQPVTVYCAANERYRHVQMHVSTVGKQPQETLASTVSFPRLEIEPVSKIAAPT